MYGKHFVYTSVTLFLYGFGRVLLYCRGNAYANHMRTGLQSCAVWLAIVSSPGTVCLYLDGAVFLYSGGDMLFMIWALARLLAPCGEQSCLPLAQFVCI